ncbi:MAG TPA: class I SAM-dependent methyltransferase, partial [Candidatus Sulfomarinibacteraceae bacterium]|nr:class I SAM-dependent methyltransferase [Candidatus Sulfomarinibacteraceae bacterium]
MIERRGPEDPQSAHSQEREILVYQRDFSQLHPETMFDERGRLQKARKTVAVILDAARATGLDPTRARVLDIGCSTGILTRHYANFFGEVVGVDIDDGAVEWAQVNRTADNIEYRVGDSLELPFADGEFDLVTCTHIYEHVPDPQRMLDEIFRVLRPGGLCYFAAENRLRLWDGHYDLPLLTVMPRPFANLVLRATGKGARRYETHLTVWGLRRLARRFEVVDFTARVVRDPEAFEAADMVRPGSLGQRLALAVLKIAPWAF